MSARRSHTPWRTLAALGAVLLGAAGCTPTCDRVCTRIVEDCGDLGTERMSAYECEESCLNQQKLYERWADTQKQAALDDELTCLVDATCDEIAAGTCYNEDIWGF